MGAGGYFAMAALIVLLIPAVVLPWEGRRAPDLLYAAIAIAGLGARALRDGWPGLGWSLVAALGCLALIGVGVTLLRAATHLQVLSGGQIKLVAAGATWLGPIGAAVMITIAVAALVAVAALQQITARRGRPDSAAILALAIAGVALQQQAHIF